MPTFWQRLRDMVKRGEKPQYIIRNPNKPPNTVSRLRLRGIGYTRPDKRRSKKRRQMAKESRRRNRGK